MTTTPRRTRSLSMAAAAQLPVIAITIITTAFAGLAALLVSGRTVTGWDLAAAAAGAAIAAAALLWVTARMRAAGDQAVARALEHRPGKNHPPASTRAMPAVPREHGGPPSADPAAYDHAAEQASVDARHAIQARVDRAAPARSTLRR